MIVLFENFKDKREEYLRTIYLILTYSTEDCYTSGELEIDSDIVYAESGDKISLITYYCANDFSITIYGGYKNETEIGYDKGLYTELETNDLMEITTILKDGVEFGSIEMEIFTKIINEKNFNEIKEILNILDYNNYPIDKCISIQQSDNYNQYLRKSKAKKFNL